MKGIAVLMLAAVAAAAARSPGQVPAPTAPGLPRTGLVAFWSGEGNARDGAGRNHVSPAHVAAITRPYALPGPETLEKVLKLIAQLGAESYADREAATKALAEMGKSIVPLLKKHLTSPDPEVRQRIGQILETSEPKEKPPVSPPDVGPRNGLIILHRR